MFQHILIVCGLIKRKLQSRPVRGRREFKLHTVFNIAGIDKIIPGPFFHVDGDHFIITVGVRKPGPVFLLTDMKDLMSHGKQQIELLGLVTF